MRIDDVTIDYEGEHAFIVLVRVQGGKRFVHRVPTDTTTAKHLDTALVQIQFEDGESGAHYDAKPWLRSPE